MSLDPLVLWLPKPPDNANARQHWARAGREKRAYWAELNLRRCYGQIPKEPSRPIPRATLLVEWHYPNLRHHLDPDNATRRLKPAVDWLVSHGYLAGDTGAHLTWFPIVSVVGQPTPLLATVRLTITPLDAPSPLPAAA